MKRIPSIKTALFYLLSVILLFTVFVKPVKAEEAEPVDNGIPVVYINIDESQGTIARMYDSVDHNVYCYGTISISVPENFHYSDFADKVLKSVDGLQMSMRGRGNSTWSAYTEKKPFKIKLDKKADILGLGENKHWVLLANHFDSTLIKNRITAWLGDQMGFDFTPRGVPVDLVLSGDIYGTKYLGSYYLSENVRVDTNRLEIDELKEGDTDPDVITGGYLLQNGYQVDKNSPDRFFTSRNADWATHTPSFDTSDNVLLGAAEEETEEAFAGRDLGDGYVNKAQQEYIQNYIQMFEDVLFEQGTEYRKLMDLESAAKYWLLQTFTLNGDGYATGSTYMYKVRDSAEGVGKIYWGPLWDFDFGWDKQAKTTGIPYGHEWIKPMLYDTADGGFVEEIHKQWPVMKENLLKLIEDGGIIDQYYEETKVSAHRDHDIYHEDSDETFEWNIEHLKGWIRERLAWFDENLSMIDNMVHKVTYMVDGEVYDILFKAESETIDGSEPFPEKDGYVFIGWTDENGNIINSTTEITEDRIITAKYLSDEEATHAADIALRKDNDMFRYNVHIFMYQIPYEIIPADAVDQKIEWTSSDEEYATVDSNGLVQYNGPGTVTLTARLKFGTTRQFTLTVIDGELPVPQAIIPEETEITLSPEEQKPIYISTDPTPTKINEYYYESGDESIVTVDEYGVLKAIGEGQTTVTIKTVSYGPDGEDIVLETTVTVTVRKPVEIVYTVSEGSTSTWKKGSTGILTYTVKRSERDETCFSHFTGVSIDDTALAKDKDYNAVSGSTVVTLKAETLNKLGEGTHTVKLTFDDGETAVTLNVTANPDSPDTGDYNGIYTVLFTLSVSVITVLFFRKKKLYS
ncbi:MAG: CotH kinase family protein [Erysipelotrichaceae bacterium]|nr:CotH kinase family protein [Erysipelotrichaceae bacterium]